MNETGIDLLLEREAVIRVLSRYARGIDRKDAALYRSCLADPIDVHAGQYGGEGLRADAWLKEAFEIAETYTTTQHLITNHEVEFPDGPKGSEARCRAYLQAQHWTAEASMLLGGHYDHRLRKEDGAWRIYRIGLEIDWMQESSP